MSSEWQFIFDQRPVRWFRSRETDRSYFDGTFVVRNVRLVFGQIRRSVRYFNDRRRYTMIRLTTFDPSLSVWSRITSCACNYRTHRRTYALIYALVRVSLVCTYVIGGLPITASLIVQSNDASSSAVFFFFLTLKAPREQDVCNACHFVPREADEFYRRRIHVDILEIRLFLYSNEEKCIFVF